VKGSIWGVGHHSIRISKDSPLEALPGMALAVAPIEKGLEAGAAPAKIHMLAEAMVTLEQGKRAITGTWNQSCRWERGRRRWGTGGIRYGNMSSKGMERV
jgi:hypothetical protein